MPGFNYHFKQFRETAEFTISAGTKQLEITITLIPTPEIRSGPIRWTKFIGKKLTWLVSNFAKTMSLTSLEILAKF